MPWLRGLDRGEERLRVVLDWRDPMVKRTFKLMLPVTLGLGLINVNALIDVFFASRFIDGDLAPTAIQKAFLVYMLPQGMFSVAIATVLFPSLSRLAARGDIDGFRDTVARRPAPDRVPAHPGRGRQRRARRADRPHPLPARRLAPGQTPVAADCLAAFSVGLVFNGAMLMLNRAFFSLQSNWIPTAVALGNLFLNALLDFALLPLRHVGDPALDRDREHRRHGRAARPDAPADRRDRRRRTAASAARIVARGGRRRRGRLRGLGAARLGARPPVRGAGRLARARARRRDRRVYLGSAACSACASSTASLAVRASAGCRAVARRRPQPPARIRSHAEPETTTNGAPISRRCAR